MNILNKEIIPLWWYRWKTRMKVLQNVKNICQVKSKRGPGEAHIFFHLVGGKITGAGIFSIN